MKYSYKSDLNELDKLSSDIALFSQEYNLNKEIDYALHLCLDEILTNIISYGMKGKDEGEVFIELELEKEELLVRAIFRDNGVEYDPLNDKNLNPDINSSIEERSIGGLGVYFLAQYMDEIKYQYINKLNTLTLIKKL